MSNAKQQFLTPVGRLLQGHPMEKQDKNMQGKPLTTQAGEPTQRYFVALGFPKTDPAFPAFYALLVQEARKSFPQLFDAAGNCIQPRFSWKLVDGDSTIPDEGGRAPCTKEGFPGHWVVRFQSSFPPKCFYAGRYAPHEQIQDANVIRRGYYARVSGTVEGNGNAQKPGLYVNLSMFELSAQGVEIVSGPDANTVFGAAAPALPMGATALPAAGAAPAMPGMPAAPQAPAMPTMPGTQPAMPGLPSFPGAMPASAPPVAPMAPVAAPALPVTPNPAFAMPGMPQPAPGVQMPGVAPVPPMAPPAPPVGPQLTPAALAAAPGLTLQGWQQQGWTEAAMRQSGYLA